MNCHPGLPRTAFFSLLVLGLHFGLCHRAGAALPPETLRSIVVAEGDEARGSGFLVLMGKQVYVVTNAHVVSGNRKIAFKTLSNRALTIGPLEVADDADLVRAPVSDGGAALSLAGPVDENARIGEAVVVAGNAEGAGVVREIPGTLVGIGPDRIEVDAAFVSGNSGSPILRPDGTVIGVATYVRVPRFFKSDSSQITSLNEVRRFGYRLETVGKWIKPAGTDEILRQGLKLKALSEMTSAITFIASLGSAEIVRRGPAVPFVQPEERERNPTLAAVSMAIEGFAAKYPAARDMKEKEAAVTRLFSALKAATASDLGADTVRNYSGFFAHRFEEELDRRKQLREWLDFLLARASQHEWVVASIWGRDETPPPDLSKIHFTLTDQFEPRQPPEKRHKISFPPEQLPSDLRGISWIVERPSNGRTTTALHLPSFRLNAPQEGLYKVFVEYRRGGVVQKLSNVLEIKVAALTDAPAKPAEPKPAPTQPLTLSPSDKPGPPDWNALAAAIARSAYSETDIVGHDSRSRLINDLPLPGGVLIGFECIVEAFKKSPGIVHGIRPIYLTGQGEKRGQTWAKQKGESEVRIVAKPGYAVGSLSGRYDGVALRKIKVRFDRIVGMKLDKKDSYESPWVGVHEGKGQESSVDTLGRLAIGLGGHHGGGLDGLRLICLDAPAP